MAKAKKNPNVVRRNAAEMRKKYNLEPSKEFWDKIKRDQIRMAKTYDRLKNKRVGR